MTARLPDPILVCVKSDADLVVGVLGVLDDISLLFPVSVIGALEASLMLPQSGIVILWYSDRSCVISESKIR